jgi:predicted dienelactone hydrolase
LEENTMRRLLRWFVLGVTLLSVAAHGAGFEPLQIELEGGRQAQGAVWYPSPTSTQETRVGPYVVPLARGGTLQDGQLPLIVISHGTGGSLAAHVSLAIALADAGYVVAALSHPADHSQDTSGFGTPAQWVDRVRDLARLVDHITTTWRGAAQVDSRRIGAFGFSAGGYTVLTAMGARPDFAKLPVFCSEHPQDQLCPALMARWDTMAGVPSPPADARLRAAVVAAPGLGALMNPQALRARASEVQLWLAEDDEVLPNAQHGDIVAKALGEAADKRIVPHAGHYAFITPCPPRLAEVVPAICRDAPNFDRQAFQQRFNAEVVQFFNLKLAMPQ